MIEMSQWIRRLHTYHIICLHIPKTNEPNAETNSPNCYPVHISKRHTYINIYSIYQDLLLLIIKNRNAQTKRISLFRWSLFLYISFFFRIKNDSFDSWVCVCAAIAVAL